MNTQPDSVLSALPSDLQNIAASIASQTGVAVSDVLVEVAMPESMAKRRGLI